VSRLRLAVVGAGRLGGFHAQKIAARDALELVAVADPLAASREALAAQCRTRAVADAAELLDQVDAVVIAVPARLHYAVGMPLLRRGVHVLMEKPLAATADEAAQLVDAARRSGAILQVGHVERFNPAFTALSDASAEGDSPIFAAGSPVGKGGALGAAKIGTVPRGRFPLRYVEAVRNGPFSLRSTDVGVVLDLMIHDLDLVLSLVRSRVRRVEAVGISVLGGHEDVAHARLEFQSGCVASLSASRVSYEAVRRMQVLSARSMAAIDFAARTATTIRPSETLLGGRFDVERLSPAEIEHYKMHFMEEHLPRQTRQFPAVDALALELDDFVDSIRSDRPPRVTGEQGRQAVALAEEILYQIAPARLKKAG
jgi:predicted dehydrogenase